MRILASNSTFQYQLNLPGYSFQGPLDLLLQMIERRELPITEISLARIADEYVVYIEQLEEVHPAELADFLVVAARLLLIKSYALLPTPPVAITEAEEEQDTAEQLLSQLREYKRIKVLNHTAGWPVQVSPTLWDVYLAALDAEKDSAGLVKATVLEALVKAGYDRSFDQLPRES